MRVEAPTHPKKKERGREKFIKKKSKKKGKKTKDFFERVSPEHQKRKNTLKTLYLIKDKASCATGTAQTRSRFSAVRFFCFLGFFWWSKSAGVVDRFRWPAAFGFPRRGPVDPNNGPSVTPRARIDFPWPISSGFSYESTFSGISAPHHKKPAPETS